MEGEGTDISAVDRWWRDGFSCLCEAAAELNQVRALAVGRLDVEGVGQGAEVEECSSVQKYNAVCVQFCSNVVMLDILFMLVK